MPIDWDAIDDALTGGRPVSGEQIVIACIVLLIGFVGAYLIGRWRRRRLAKLQDQTREFAGLAARIGQMLFLAIAVGWALSVLGVAVGWLTIVLVAAGFIVVLAARPVLEGMGASAALVTRPAFGIGDEIAVDDIVGEVVEITNRSTVIRLRDTRRVHIPNVEMLAKTVTVYTVDRSRRSAAEVTVGFENDLDHVDEVLRRELTELDTIDRVGSIRARALTTGVELSGRFWHRRASREAMTP